MTISKSLMFFANKYATESPSPYPSDECREGPIKFCLPLLCSGTRSDDSYVSHNESNRVLRAS